jgi:hypothetical protein
MKIMGVIIMKLNLKYLAAFVLILSVNSVAMSMEQIDRSNSSTQHPELNTQQQLATQNVARRIATGTWYVTKQILSSILYTIDFLFSKVNEAGSTLPNAPQTDQINGTRQLVDQHATDQHAIEAPGIQTTTGPANSTPTDDFIIGEEEICLICREIIEPEQQIVVQTVGTCKCKVRRFFHKNPCFDEMVTRGFNVTNCMLCAGQINNQLLKIGKAKPKPPFPISKEALQEVKKAIDNHEEAVLKLFGDAMYKFPEPIDDIIKQIDTKVKEIKSTVSYVLDNTQGGTCDNLQETKAHIKQCLETVKKTYEKLIAFVDTHKKQEETERLKTSIDILARRIEQELKQAQPGTSNSLTRQLAQDFFKLSQEQRDLLTIKLDLETLTNYLNRLLQTQDRAKVYKFFFSMPLSLQKQFFLRANTAQLHALLCDMLQLLSQDGTLYYIPELRILITCLPDKSKIIIFEELFKFNKAQALKILYAMDDFSIIKNFSPDTQIALLIQIIEQNKTGFANEFFSYLPLIHKATILRTIYEFNPEYGQMLFSNTSSIITKTGLLEILSKGSREIATRLLQNESNKYQIFLQNPVLTIRELIDKSNTDESTIICRIKEILDQASLYSEDSRALDLLFKTNLLNIREIIELKRYVDASTWQTIFRSLSADKVIELFDQIQTHSEKAELINFMTKDMATDVFLKLKTTIDQIEFFNQLSPEIKTYILSVLINKEPFDIRLIDLIDNTIVNQLETDTQQKLLERAYANGNTDLLKKVFKLLNQETQYSFFAKSNPALQVIFLSCLNDISMIAKFTKNLSVDQLEQIINNTPEQDKLNLFNLTDSELRLN